MNCKRLPSQPALMAAIALMAALSLSSKAFGAGFAINEVGARALGMANAMTGMADRPSSIYFNPGALGFVEGLQFDLSLSLIAPGFSYDTNVPGSGEAVNVPAESKLFPVPALYASFKPHDIVTIGLGVWSPFGLGVEWADTVNVNGTQVPWWGRGAIQEIELQTVNFAPTIALKLHERFSVGVGFTVMKAAVFLRRAVTRSSNLDDDVTVQLSGDDIGFGATAGMLVKIIPDVLNFGISYRSAIALRFEGEAAFSKEGGIPSGLRSQLTDGRVAAEIEMPHNVSFGLTAFPTEALTVSLNVDVLTWSSYEKLAIDFIDNPSLSSAQVRNWSTSFTVRLGGEYKLLEDNLPLRLGVVYDQSPAPDETIGPELPDVDRFIIGGGLGYTWQGLRADLAYQYLFSASAQTGPNVAIVGSRSANAHIFALGLGYALDI